MHTTSQLPNLTSHSDLSYASDTDVSAQQASASMGEFANMLITSELRARRSMVYNDVSFSERRKLPVSHRGHSRRVVCP